MSKENQEKYWLDPRHLEYHRRQFSTPYRSIMALGELLRARIGGAMAGRAVDVACGAGANICHLGRMFPGVQWTGVDIADALFPLGLQLMRDEGMDPLPHLQKADAYRLCNVLPAGSFDLTFSIQTLSWMPAYEEPLEQLFKVTRPGGWIVISSLFTDSLVDAQIEIRQYPNGPAAPFDGPSHYNIYCMERFEGVCRKLGASDVISADFEMDVDLPKPEHRLMGTYTERMSSGRRLQVSGPLLMPWKFVLIRVA